MKLINSDKVPGALGHYSRGAMLDNLVFFSGQVGIGTDGNIVPGGIKEQTQTILSNLQILLAEAGLEKTNICKVNVYIAKMDDEKFQSFNQVYSKWFGDHKPSRTAIGVYSLPKGGSVEIETIAEPS